MTTVRDIVITVAILTVAVTAARAAGDAGARPNSQSLARAILGATGIKGGLIVHIGCGNGELTAAFHVNDSYLVHGLDRNQRNVETARAHIHGVSSYGPVSVAQWTGTQLPYADNLVNLLVIEDREAIPMEEVNRVLAPLGVAYYKHGDSWTKTVKPWPDEIDEWTHWLHGADGNAVAADRVVGPPRRIQWTAKPFWMRHHNTVPSTSAMVSSKGRLFYISDEGPASVDGTLPDRWFLVARDAFNGVPLWKRPMPQWGWKQWSGDWWG